MRILLVNTYDLKGGAARATWRLFEGLLGKGNEVKMLVQQKRSKDPGVIVVDSPSSRFFNPFRPYLDFAVPLLQTRNRVLFSTALIPDQVVKEIERIDPDVVHLNWITGGFLQIESLAKIGAPVVWTLHDMWAFTGGCHNTVDCTRYMQSCGCCPILHSSHENDLSRRVFKRKQRAYAAMQNLTITSPSQWLAQRVKESPLLKTKRGEVIPNGIDTSVFAPGDRRTIRRQLGMPENKKLILFGAIRGIKNRIKGFGLLLEALKGFDPDKFELLVFGSDHSPLVQLLKIKTSFFGTIAEEKKLASLYSAADVVAVPSYQEVFGQVASEAMACGTPVVAFAQTGLLDIVKHEETGYLAKPYDPSGLTRGIEWILDDAARYRQLCVAARKRAVEKFDLALVAEQMMRLYQDVIDGN